MLSKFTKDVPAVLGIIDKMLKVSEADFKKMLKEYVKDVTGLMKILKTSDVSKLDGADDLKELFELLPDNCVFSASTVRGLAYYTGTVFEVYDKKGKLRALAGGGRYDSLLEQYGGRKTPAVGFGLGYTTLRLFLEQQKLLPKINLGADYLVIGKAITNSNDPAKTAEEIRYSIG